MKSFHFYMVFLGIVCKIKLKYSKELLDYKVKNTKTYNKGYHESWWNEVLKTFKLGRFLISEGILFNRMDSM